MNDSARDDPDDALDLGLAAAFAPTSGGSAPPSRVTLDHRGPAPPELPHRTGRYLILGSIGAGGVGEVLHGRDADLGRDVAIKVLQARHRHDPGALHRFLDEARIGGQLEHPGIVPVHDLGLLDDRPFFAMKVVRGQTLAALLAARSDPHTGRIAMLHVFEKVGQTVAYAHTCGVVHRDLKPANVMVGSHGEVHVIDWGMAKVLAADGVGAAEQGLADAAAPSTAAASQRSPSQFGSILGTPAYMAPEQARGEVTAIDRRTDVFALGAILCEILTGAPPYAGDSVATLQRAANGDLAAAAAALAACDADAALVDLCTACLAPVADTRPASASVVAERITGYLHDVEARAQQQRLLAAEERGRATSARRVHRLTLALAGFVVAALATGVTAYVAYGHEQRREQQLARNGLVDALAAAEGQRARAAQAPPHDAVAWQLAVAAAARTEPFLDRTGDADLTDRARALTAAIDASARAAAAAAQRHGERQAMLERLDEIAGLWEEHEEEAFGAPKAERDRRRRARNQRQDAHQDAAYTRVFGDVGVDAGHPAEHNAARLGAFDCPTELASALDHWAMVRWRQRPRDAASFEWILATAKALDPEPWRDQLRDSVRLLDRDAARQRVSTLLATADLAALPARSLELLARRLASTGAGREAQTVYATAIARFPDDFALAHWSGAFHLTEGRNVEAATDLGRALALRADNALVRRRLAAANSLAGQLGIARTHYRELARVQPQRAEWLAHIAAVSLRIGATAEAEADAAVRRALELDPDHAFAASTYGLLLVRRGDPAGALTMFERAARRRPHYALDRFNIGNCLTYLGRHEEAFAAFGVAIALDPESASPVINLGATLRRHGDDQLAAERCLRRGIALDPASDLAHLHLGLCLRAQGRFVEAEAAIATAAQLQTDRAVPASNQASPHLDKLRPLAERQRREAEAFLARIGNPAPAAAMVEAGALALHWQRPKTALRWFRAALSETLPEAHVPLRGPHRGAAMAAAAVAALAETDDAERGALCAEARGWLEAEFAAWVSWRENAQPYLRWLAGVELADWLACPEFAPWRDEAAVAALPAPERERWTDLWARVRVASVP
ncbi:MAG: protein kinase [Planctomycetes bacterium]|nr:protein kinase [Planctomycetota bacterium]